MSARLGIILMFLLFSTPGCVGRALHPAFTSSDVVSEPGLIGEWEGLPKPPGPAFAADATWEPSGTWNVRRGAEGSYRVRHLEGDEISSYRAHAFRLGRRLFLDLAPDPPDQWKERYAFHFALCHTFSSLRFSGDTLIVGSLRDGWLKDLSEKGQLDRSLGLVLDEEGNAILTGNTAAMRNLLGRAANDPRAFCVGRFLRVR